MIQVEIIQDVVLPSVNDRLFVLRVSLATDGSDYFKVILMERDKVMTLNFVKNQISQGIDDGPYH